MQASATGVQLDVACPSSLRWVLALLTTSAGTSTTYLVLVDGPPLAFPSSLLHPDDAF